MGDNDDFTFCQVSPPKVDDHLEMPKIFPNITRISLDDNHLHTDGVQRVGDTVKDDGLCDNATSKGLLSNSSPSNNINEMSPRPPEFNLQESRTPKAARDVGDSPSDPQAQKSPSKKPAVRAKVPYEKGYSQMDWLKLTRSNADLAGLKGQSNRRLISMDEVKKHKTEGSVWTVLKGRVYNISPYMKFHPGGVDMLMKAAGKDCTTLFNKYHAWVNAEFLLEKCLVGVLDGSSG